MSSARISLEHTILLCLSDEQIYESAWALSVELSVLIIVHLQEISEGRYIYVVSHVLKSRECSGCYSLKYHLC